MIDEYTIKLSIHGDVSKMPNEWVDEELPRISELIAEGFTSGKVIVEGADGGWWEVSRNTKLT